MLYQDFNNEKDAKEYLYFITGQSYCFAQTSERMWGNSKETEHAKSEPFYQIMPVSLDDGFFGWYCYVRENCQNFRTKEMCVLHFIKYWTEWTRKGKPSWK